MQTPSRRLSLSLAVCGVAAVATAAWARKVEDAYAGKVVISPKGFPREIDDPDTFIHYLQKNGVDTLSEDKDKSGKEKGSWQLRYMAFFKQPLSDVTLEVKFYEISNGDNQLISSFDLDSLDRGQRILASTITVTKDDGFEANKKYHMTIEDEGKIMAETTITLAGEGDHYSGQVSFTDSETSQP